MATMLNSSIENKCLFESLCRHRGVLVIDFDSTIARLGSADNVFPYPTVKELLDSIVTMTGTRVIVATRRPAEQLRGYFGHPGPEICSTKDLGAPEGIGGSAPLVYLAGDHKDVRLTASHRLRVLPQYRIGEGNDAAPAEGLVQFLVDWLRACTGDIC